MPNCINGERSRRLIITFIILITVYLGLIASSEEYAYTSAQDDPQPVYSSDPNDTWNRIFYRLFTRTVSYKLTDDFPDGAPFLKLEVMGFSNGLPVSTRLFERVEIGDRGIEPFYPSFITSAGLREALSDKHFSPYKNVLIYFWSGTGNSYRVSTWMGKVAEENGLNTRVSSIDKSNPAEEIKGGNDSLMGIVFPTHGFTAPWHILKFVWSLPHSHSTRGFCVATRAGLKFGPVFIPGISGSATFIITLILLLKGYDVRGSMSVDMPSNWYSLFLML